MVQKMDWHRELIVAVEQFNKAIERAQVVKGGQKPKDTDAAYQDLAIAEQGIVYVALKLNEHEGGLRNETGTESRASGR